MLCLPCSVDMESDGLQYALGISAAPGWECLRGRKYYLNLGMNYSQGPEVVRPEREAEQVGCPGPGFLRKEFPGGLLEEVQWHYALKGKKAAASDRHPGVCKAGKVKSRRETITLSEMGSLETQGFMPFSHAALKGR